MITCSDKRINKELNLYELADSAEQLIWQITKISNPEQEARVVKSIIISTTNNYKYFLNIWSIINKQCIWQPCQG